MPYELVGLAVVAPLAGFLINGLAGARLKREAVSGWIGSAAVGLSFAIALALFCRSPRPAGG